MKGSTMVACEVCTFENVPGATQCAICGSLAAAPSAAASSAAASRTCAVKATAAEPPPSPPAKRHCVGGSCPTPLGLNVTVYDAGTMSDDESVLRVAPAPAPRRGERRATSFARLTMLSWNLGFECTNRSGTRRGCMTHLYTIGDVINNAYEEARGRGASFVAAFQEFELGRPGAYCAHALLSLRLDPRLRWVDPETLATGPCRKARALLVSSDVEIERFGDSPARLVVTGHGSPPHRSLLILLSVRPRSVRGCECCRRGRGTGPRWPL